MGQEKTSSEEGVSGDSGSCCSSGSEDDEGPEPELQLPLSDDPVDMREERWRKGRGLE